MCGKSDGAGKGSRLVDRRGMDRRIEIPDLGQPAVGAGGMVLAFARVMMEEGHAPHRWLLVQCIDADRMVALMCYIQLSLWHIPAEIVVGDTLSMKACEVFHTPACHLGNWHCRLERHHQQSIRVAVPPGSVL